jgi:hypothetical protein
LERWWRDKLQPHEAQLTHHGFFRASDNNRLPALQLIVETPQLRLPGLQRREAVVRRQRLHC